MAQIKGIRKDLLLGGFVGGIVISLLELATTLKAGDFHLVTVFFFIGCFISGIIGVIGSLMISPNDFRNAVSAGVAAPSLLGGMLQSGVATTTTAFMLNVVSPPVFADTSAVLDSI